MTDKKSHGSCGGNCECECGPSEDPVWIDPSQYDVTRDGPGYLPSPVASQSQIPKQARVMARKASQVISPLVTSTLTGMGTVTSDPEVLKGLPLVDLLKVLSAVALVHHTCHWLTSGPQYYGDHLLFDRIYTDVLGHIDQVAERAIGLGAGSLVTPDAISRGSLQVVEALGVLGSDPEGLVQASLEAARFALGACTVVQSCLSTAGNLTGGTSNLLEGLTDKYEEHIYLLGQRNKV